MKRILAVDDDPSILKALKLVLGSEHVVVDTVENGAGTSPMGTGVQSRWKARVNRESIFHIRLPLCG